MIEDTLTELGFVRTQNDEPHEDYWLYELYGAGTDMLVEIDADGWQVSRSPSAEEHKGQWIELASDLDEEALLRTIREQLAVEPN